jgi:hypothetical protein
LFFLGFGAGGTNGSADASTGGASADEDTTIVGTAILGMSGATDFLLYVVRGFFVASMFGSVANDFRLVYFLFVVSVAGVVVVAASTGIFGLRGRTDFLLLVDSSTVVGNTGVSTMSSTSAVEVAGSSAGVLGTVSSI